MQALVSKKNNVLLFHGVFISDVKNFWQCIANIPEWSSVLNSSDLRYFL